MVQLNVYKGNYLKTKQVRYSYTDILFEYPLKCNSNDSNTSQSIHNHVINFSSFKMSILFHVTLNWVSFTSEEEMAHKTDLWIKH